MLSNTKKLMEQHTDQEIVNQINDARIFDYHFKPKNPSRLLNPNFMMSLPFSFHTEEANNAWMTDKNTQEREVDSDAAFQQFQKLYQFMVSQGAFVHLMPVPRDCHLQDLVFCANSGIVLTHLEDRNTVHPHQSTAGFKRNQIHGAGASQRNDEARNSF